MKKNMTQPTTEAPKLAGGKCTAVDADCAPPFQCELSAGHEGPHQWKRGETPKQWTDKKGN